MRPRARRFISTDGYAELVKHALAGSDGLCAAHSGRTDMRELGSRGGKARRAGVVEQLPKPERESLRHHLRAQLRLGPGRGKPGRSVRHSTAPNRVRSVRNRPGTGSVAEVAELLGDSKRVAADHYVHALTD